MRIQVRFKEQKRTGQWICEAGTKEWKYYIADITEPGVPPEDDRLDWYLDIAEALELKDFSYVGYNGMFYFLEFEDDDLEEVTERLVDEFSTAWD